MLDGWYCRSMNEQALQQQQQQMQQQHPHPSQMHQRRSSLDGADDMGDRDGGDSSGQEEDSDEDIIPTRRNVDYKTQYNTLKKKLKYLLYENEFFQENLRTSQQRQHQAQIMAQLQAQSQQFHQQHQLVNNHHHQQQQQQQHQEGHLTTEEVERHLQSRAQSMLEVVPEGELPNEMFSQNPSSESNDQMVDTSPSNIGEECLSADLNMMQQE